MKDWKYHCAILGVRENASAPEIRQAYRQLALERHPDKHQNSTRAKEEFQELNESYRFLIDGLAEGQAPPAARHSAAPNHAAQPWSPPAPTRGSPPAPIQKQNGWKLWLHSAAVFATLLAISVWSELGQNRAPASKQKARDLSEQSFCWIKAHGGKDEPTIEVTTEAACREKCGTSDGSDCRWSGTPLFPISAPPTAPALAAAPIARACRISLLRTGTPEQDYKLASERDCRSFCNQLKDTYPKAGVHCAWETASFFDREEAKGAGEVFAPANEAPPLPEEDMATTCLISSVSTDGPRTLSIPQLSDSQCADQCVKTILSDLHADAECYYAGRRIKRYFPDRSQIYLEEHPEAAATITGTPSTARCQIVAVKGTQSVSLLSAILPEEDCRTACTRRASLTTASVHVACTFGNSPIQSQNH